MTTPIRDRPVGLGELAAIVGASAKTISQWLIESHAGGRYASRPIPTPDGRIGRSPWWWASRINEIRQWDDGRPGRIIGRGRRRGTPTTIN